MSTELSVFRDWVVDERGNVIILQSFTPASADEVKVAALSLPDFIEWAVAALIVEGGEIVKVTDSGKRDWIDPVIRLVPNNLEYGDRYLVYGPIPETPEAT